MSLRGVTAAAWMAGAWPDPYGTIPGRTRMLALLGPLVISRTQRQPSGDKTAHALHQFGGGAPHANIIQGAVHCMQTSVEPGLFVQIIIRKQGFECKPASGGGGRMQIRGGT